MYFSTEFLVNKTLFFVKLISIQFFLFVFINISNAQYANLKIIDSFPIKGTEGWDYIAIHEATQRLFVAHGTQVNVLNAKTGDSIGIIPNTFGVHGVTFIDALNKGYTSNGRMNNVYVFNLQTLVIEDSIAVGNDPDAIFYNEINRKLYICNGRSMDISVIDPFTKSMVATIPIGGKPETAVADKVGNVYVNIENKHEIIKINGGTNEIMEHWNIAPAEAPTGLVYDAHTHTLFAGCSNKMLAVVDAANGIVKKIVPIGAGCDGVAIDFIWRQVYASNGQEGTLSIISANNYELLNTLKTMKTARTIAVSQDLHNVYLPAAEINKTMVPGKKPALKPESFRILVIGKDQN